jgi:thiol-disulfide isomerase/thioredoxin
MNLSGRVSFVAAALTVATLSIAAPGVLRASAQTPKQVPAGTIASAQGQAEKGKLGKVLATADLTLDPQALNMDALRKLSMGYMPSTIALATEKPAGIKKEPAYIGTPRYGVVAVGNGPNKETFVVVDDKEDGGGKLYVDSNRNGDLTDDGDNAWAQETKKDGNTYYSVTQRLVRASWADPKTTDKETSTGPYSLGFYYTVGASRLSLFRQTARVGSLTLNDKQVPVMLIENDSDGIYDRTLVPPPAAVGSAPARVRPVWLNINTSPTQPALPDVPRQVLNVNGPFRLQGKVYEARVTPDGSKITLYESDAVIPEPPKLPPAPSLLAVGKDAPDFTVSLPGGGTTTLAALKGKVVILDFWATWCGPCQSAMPHLEGVYQQLKSRDDATVLAVCVSDERNAFDKWVGANIGTKYNFPVAFDLAATDGSKSISRNKYGVSGIPTQFVIGKDGKIAAAFVGYRPGQHVLEDALNKLGIPVTAPTEPTATAQANAQK